MGGLVVEQVLRDGKDRGVNLTFDMSKTEDEGMLPHVWHDWWPPCRAVLTPGCRNARSSVG